MFAKMIDIDKMNWIRDFMKVILLCVYEKRRMFAVPFEKAARWQRKHDAYRKWKQSDAYTYTVCERARNNRLYVKEPFLINC